MQCDLRPSSKISLSLFFPGQTQLAQAIHPSIHPSQRQRGVGDEANGRKSGGILTYTLALLGGPSPVRIKCRLAIPYIACIISLLEQVSTLGLHGINFPFIFPSFSLSFSLSFIVTGFSIELNQAANSPPWAHLPHT